DTEAAGASDDLATIYGGEDGMMICIRAENTARTIVIKHGTGNIECGGADVSLDATDQYAMLLYDRALSKWVMVGGSGGGVAGDVVGPAGAVDGKVALFDGATGKLIKDGGVSLGAGTSGGVPYYSAAATLGSSAALTANAVVVGGGAGASPATISASTTTTHALFATAGAPAFRAIAGTDGVLLAPTGTSWENRTYKGYEVVDTETTYTIGSGQDFASLYAASLALRGLILEADVNLVLTGHIEETTAIIFTGLISSGGMLRIDPTDSDYTVTLNPTGTSQRALTFSGPVRAWIGYSTATNKGTLKAGKDMDALVQVTYGAYLSLAAKAIDADSKTIAKLIYVNNRAVLRQQTTAWSNIGSVTACCLVAYSGEARMDSDPTSLTVSAGGFVVNAAGNLITAAGTFTP
ncbi:MAG: hypothetical protein PHU49_16715, partial [Syntrophorhabdaceae bacterium]|nr:hypothetical protein [Syntrophorhabdaceae bacterium]